MSSHKRPLFRAPLVASTAVLLVAHLDAQRVCLPVRPGDSAALLARKLTGRPSSRHAQWFEIVDEHWRPVAKEAYPVVLPGWLACVPLVRPVTVAAAPTAAPQMHPVTSDPHDRLIQAVAAMTDPGFLAIAGTLALFRSVARWVARHRRRRRTHPA